MSFFDGFHDLYLGQNSIDAAKVERLGFVFSIKSFFFAASKQGAFILCYTVARVVRTNMCCSCEGNLNKKVYCTTYIFRWESSFFDPYCFPLADNCLIFKGVMHEFLRIFAKTY